MRSFSDGDPVFENNVSRESVGDIPSMGEAPSGSRPFDIWKTKHGHKDWRKNEVVSVEERPGLRRGSWQGHPFRYTRDCAGWQPEFRNLIDGAQSFEQYIGMLWRRIAKTRNFFNDRPIHDNIVKYQAFRTLLSTHESPSQSTLN